MIPLDKAAEFFGFYNMLGKFAAVMGPLLVGVISISTGSHRWGMLSILLLFVIGVLLLMKVNVKAAEQLVKTS